MAGRHRVLTGEEARAVFGDLIDWGGLPPEALQGPPEGLQALLAVPPRSYTGPERSALLRGSWTRKRVQGKDLAALDWGGQGRDLAALDWGSLAGWLALATR